MVSDVQLRFLLDGVADWNDWRKENPDKWIDLSFAHLSGADLNGANLRRADLNGAHLSGANLRRADLSWANLNRANLNGAHLSGANLRRADLKDADLSGADLNGADLRDADLSDADLIQADLRDADLNGADLSGAKQFIRDLEELKDTKQKDMIELIHLQGIKIGIYDLILVGFLFFIISCARYIAFLLKVSNESPVQIIFFISNWWLVILYLFITTIHLYRLIMKTGTYIKD